MIEIPAAAVALFEGDEERAMKWLTEPNRALGWESPAELMATGRESDVIALITRIEHGVYN